MSDPVLNYAQTVTFGHRIGCRWEVLACQRHLDDLAAGLFYFDAGAAAKAISIFKLLKHYKGKLAGQPFRLHPSQEFIIGSLYGWKLKAGGPRRFTSGYMELPRKNGKTTLSAGVGVLGLLEERGAEVYSVATKEDQAKIGWKDGRAMIKASPGLNARLSLRIKEIRFDDRDASWRPLGSDSETLDGLNPSLAIMDELHAWTNRDLFDVIEDGMGAREQPLIFAITTAGSNHLGICMERRNLICSILEKRVPGERMFGIIFAAEKEDDPHSPATWHKANPLLGEAKSLQFMQDQSDLVKAAPGKLNAFLTKQLNIWVQQEVRWLNLDDWDKCAGGDEVPDLAGLTCSAGLDLASVNDLTALVRYFRRPGEAGIILPMFWLPEENMLPRVKRDRVPYDLWVKQGFIKITPGNTTDYDFIRADINKMHAANQFKGIAYDRWNSTQLSTQLIGDGIDMIPFGQGFVSMNPAAKEFERRLLSRKIHHYGNPVLRWMAGHVAKQEDAAGNIKPSKEKSRERIDGIVAAVMAIGHDINRPEIKKTVYASRGVRVL